MSKENKKLDSGQKAMQEVMKFRESIKDKTEKELLEIEQNLLKEQDEHNKARMEKKYAMPSKNYKEAATAIRMALDSMTVQWQYALVLKTLYELFDPEKKPAEIQYAMLDSLLHQLSNASLKGYEQWNAVVTISDYFEPIREAYAEDAAEIYTDAEKHNVVIQQLELFKTNAKKEEVAN